MKTPYQNYKPRFFDVFLETRIGVKVDDFKLHIAGQTKKLDQQTKDDFQPLEADFTKLDLSLTPGEKEGKIKNRGL